MTAPQYSAADFLAAFQSLLPRGRAWPRDADSVQTKVLSGLSQIYARQSIRSNQLLVDAFPLTTFELLPQWEDTLGLPDPCAGVQPTVSARRDQVVTRIKAQGGQSAQYFIGLASDLGYSITITEYAPARAGCLRAGAPDCGADWAFAWQINSVLNAMQRAQAGVLTAGEPIAYWSNAVLECEIKDLKPAHTILIFAYHAPTGVIGETFIIGTSALA